MVAGINGRKPMFMIVKNRSEVRAVGVVLYVGLVIVSTSAVAAADWADHLALLPLVGIFGALTGVALARSLFRGWVATIIASVNGIFTTFWLLSATLDLAFTFRQRLLILGGRLGAFLGVVIQGVENQDPLMVVLLLSLLYWGLSVYGAWALFRRKAPWGAVLPLGFTLLINTYYYLGRARLDLLLATYVLIGLLIILYHEIQNQLNQWRKIRSRVSSNTLFAVARIGAVIALVLVAVSWGGPAFAGSEAAERAWNVVSRPWQVTRDRIGKLFYSLRSPVTFVGDEFRDLLTLQAGAQPSDQLVMEVSPNEQISGPGRFYWRARTYDTYEDGSWEHSDLTRQNFDPRQGDLRLAEYAGREEVLVKVAPSDAVQRSLFVPGQTVWIDRPAELQVQKVEGRIVDVSVFQAKRPIYRGEVYQARGLVAVPRAEQLRQAGEDYPEWIQEKYLQVPVEISQRTKGLARQITAEEPTPYDKATAITEWMRDNIEYQRVTAAPPEGREPIDWFLFDYGIGFCNYYASAEVIMLRSLGIPARLAVGYARGDYDAQIESYIVTAKEYHAWPEVYFPGFGWVEFEPTVSQPALVRPEPGTAEGEEATQALTNEGLSSETLDELKRRSMEDLLANQEALDDQGASLIGDLSRSRFLMGFVLLVGLGVGLWTRLDAGWRLTINQVARRFSRQAEGDSESEQGSTRIELSSSLERAYFRWLAWWPRLGLQVRQDQTPLERAALFAHSYPEIAEYSRPIAEAYASKRFGGEEFRYRHWQAGWKPLQRGLWRAYIDHSIERMLDWIRLRTKLFNRNRSIDSMNFKDWELLREES